jgi:hypothetical protein
MFYVFNAITNDIQLLKIVFLAPVGVNVTQNKFVLLYYIFYEFVDIFLCNIKIVCTIICFYLY